MSYSFTITEATKERALNAVRAQMTEIAIGQPAHEVDKEAVVKTAKDFIDMLVDPVGNEYIGVSVSGYVSWRGDSAEKKFTGASVNISAYLKAREPA